MIVFKKLIYSVLRRKHRAGEILERHLKAWQHVQVQNGVCQWMCHAINMTSWRICTFNRPSWTVEITFYLVLVISGRNMFFFFLLFVCLHNAHYCLWPLTISDEHIWCDFRFVSFQQRKRKSCTEWMAHSDRASWRPSWVHPVLVKVRSWIFWRALCMYSMQILHSINEKPFDDHLGNNENSKLIPVKRVSPGKSQWTAKIDRAIQKIFAMCPPTFIRTMRCVHI